MIKKTIRYAVKYEEFTVTEAEFQLVQELYKLEQKVIAIKLIRGQYGLGLKEAKDICDGIAITAANVNTYSINRAY